MSEIPSSEATQPRRLDQWLHEASSRLQSAGDASALACIALHCSRAWLFAHGDHALDNEQRARLDELMLQRERGVPVAYLAGEREFYGRSFSVDDRVLIPRPETEHLVEFALALDLPADARVVDIGTGSGCIILTLAAERNDWRCTGTDADEQALAVAQSNRDRLDLSRVRLLKGHLFSPLANESFELIVSNPPYVQTHDPHLKQGDLRFEPNLALDAGEDALSVLRELIAGARSYLVRGGWLALEHGHDQSAQVRGLMREAGYSDISSQCDLAGIERISTGRMLHPRP